MNSRSRGSSKFDDLAAHGGILEVSDFDRASGAKLVIGVDRRNASCGVVWWESGELFCVGWVVWVRFGFGKSMRR